MAEDPAGLLFDLPPEDRTARSLQRATLPDPDRERIKRKIRLLSPALRSAFPDPDRLSWSDFWLTPHQCGRLCGGISDDSVIRHMYEGTQFHSAINVSRGGSPVFRIPLEDAVDFLLSRREGAYEEQTEPGGQP